MSAADDLLREAYDWLTVTTQPHTAKELLLLRGRIDAYLNALSSPAPDSTAYTNVYGVSDLGEKLAMALSYIESLEVPSTLEGSSQHFAAHEAVTEAIRAYRPAPDTQGKAEGAIEKLKNIIDGYAWLADGRGPYADDDHHYDEDVQRFVRELLDNLEPGRWEPWQTVLTKLRNYEADTQGSEGLREACEELLLHVMTVENGMDVCRLCGAQTSFRHPSDQHQGGCVVLEIADALTAPAPDASQPASDGLREALNGLLISARNIQTATLKSTPPVDRIPYSTAVDTLVRNIEAVCALTASPQQAGGQG